MNKVILQIEGMSCSACSNGLEKYLKKQKGIVEANVNLVLAQAMITYEEPLTIEDLNRFVEEAGFQSLGEFKPNQKEKKTNQKGIFLFYTGILLLFLYLSMGPMVHLPSIPFWNQNHPVAYTTLLLGLTLLFLFYGRDIFMSGIKNAWHKTPNMDTLVTLGVTSSFLFSLVYSFAIWQGQFHYVHQLYYESVVMIVYFMKLGRLIDKKSKEKTKLAIQELVQVTPTKALVKEGEELREVTIDEVHPHDQLVAKPGMKIAVDGVITKGETHLEEAFITGESVPVKKTIGEEVIAGSMNVDGYIEYEAKRIGKDSTISEIVRLVVEATNTKAPIGRLADRVSSYFVPIVIGIAFLTGIGYLVLENSISTSMNAFVTVLVVACPCALGLSTPLAMVVSVGNCAKSGILIKSSEILERAHKVSVVVFDKTGTLTYGNLKVDTLYHNQQYQEQELLAWITSIESLSNHPISKAFSKEDYGIYEVTHFETLAGMGIHGLVEKKDIYLGNEKILEKLSLSNRYQKEAQELVEQGDSLLYIVVNQQLVGVLGVKDIVREDAKRTIHTLQKMGKEVIMLTGDHEKTAQLIASSLGIQKVISNVLPKEKTKFIQKLIQEGAVVMMVGDGINDAPSLASADIGVSIHSGTDIASDSSDVILMKDQIEKIPLLLRIGQKTILNIKENLFWAFFYNIIMLPIAIGFFKPWGITMNPMVASLAMTCSSLTVVWNALRLRKIS